MYSCDIVRFFYRLLACSIMVFNASLIRVLFIGVLVESVITTGKILSVK